MTGKVVVNPGASSPSTMASALRQKRSTTH
jgi:hypothetical protein